MKHIRISMIAVALLFATGAFGQGNDGKNQGNGPAASQSHGMPTVEEQLKVLTAKLDLTAEQQTKVKPILQELHDATVKLIHDDKLSQEERLNKVRPMRYSADRKIREFLSDEQQKKLDAYLQGDHHEMHGSLTGGNKTPAQSPKQ